MADKKNAPQNAPHNAVVLGLGQVGTNLLKAITDDPRFTVTAAVDAREDREEVARGAGFTGAVYADAKDIPAGSGVALVCTSSKPEEVAASAATLVGLGYDVVSSCEALIVPHVEDSEALSSLDKTAREAGRTVIAGGVNPGFVMDVLPACLTLASRDVTGVKIIRRVDVSTRREKLQEKVGARITLAEFAERHAAGNIGHVGLPESMEFVAKALGWEGKVVETIEPVVDDSGERSLGVRHKSTVTDADGVVRVDGLLEMYLGAPQGDHITVEGEPTIELELKGGVAGDTATVSAVLNVAAWASDLPAGVVSLLDVLPPTWYHAKA
jgi:4-hydroxy-tetrahydrodipicolinate reductase